MKVAVQLSPRRSVATCALRDCPSRRPPRFAPHLVKAALSLLLAGAQAAIAQPVSIDSEIDAVLAAVRAARGADELEAAREELLRLSRRQPRDLHPVFPGRSRALLEAAALGRRLGAGNAAAGELLQILEREPESDWTPRAHLELAGLLLDRGDWRLAADHLGQARTRALAQVEGDVLGRPDDESSRVDVAQLALERMTGIHRLVLRPLAGRSPWTKAGIYLPDDYVPEPLRMKRPRTVAAGPRGELLVADNKWVVLLDRQRAVVANRQMRGVVRADLSPDGPLSGLSALVVMPDRVLPVVAPAAVPFERPSGGKLDQIVGVYREPFGGWVVLSRRVDVVLRYDSSGRLVSFSSATVVRPVDLAPGPDGAVHVLDAGSRSSSPSLLTFGGDWSLTATLSGAWQRPAALTVDTFGNRYVLDEATRRVLVYDREGTELTVLGPVLPGGYFELQNPTDIAVDGMGRVFISEGRLETVLVVE